MRAMFTLLLAAVASAAPGNHNRRATTGNTILVVVGGSELVFTPNNIVAAPGDTVQFQFAAHNHTVTQAAASSPCAPLQATVAGAVHSGFVPYDNTTGTVGTFDLLINDTQPMFLYCAQGSHCQAGMVMAINVNSTQQLIAFSNLAANQTSNTPAAAVAGGTVGSIAGDNAAFAYN
ncbi:Cupredoxin [Xylariales sp. PMI_506]|nr:Cupredoxin [Xylariales sp. PMI_506]